MPVVLYINLKGADAKIILAYHLDIAVRSQDCGLRAVETDLQVTERERFVSWRAAGHGRDVLLFCLHLPAGVSILEIVCHEALERRAVLFDRPLHPTERRLVYELRGIRGKAGMRESKYEIDSRDTELRRFPHIDQYQGCIRTSKPKILVLLERISAWRISWRSLRLGGEC